MYRREPLGYEYELLQAYAEHPGVGLKIIVEKDAGAMFERLRATAGSGGRRFRPHRAAA